MSALVNNNLGAVWLHFSIANSIVSKESSNWYSNARTRLTINNYPEESSLFALKLLILVKTHYTLNTMF